MTLPWREDEKEEGWEGERERECSLSTQKVCFECKVLYTFINVHTMQGTNRKKKDQQDGIAGGSTYMPSKPANLI